MPNQCQELSGTAIDFFGLFGDREVSDGMGTHDHWRSDVQIGVGGVRKEKKKPHNRASLWGLCMEYVRFALA
jgi:hypothetical protein